MEQERLAQAGAVWFPFLVLGHWKREEPGDKSGTGPFPPPFSRGEVSHISMGPAWSPLLALVSGFPWIWCAAGPGGTISHRLWFHLQRQGWWTEKLEAGAS